MRIPVTRFRLSLSMVLAGWLLAMPAMAQVPAAPAAGTNVELDPIRCWWRTSAGAVRVGELFDMALTCAVLENDAVQVMPDESRLAPATITLAPFEVVSGTHPADLHSGSRRFFQYQYKLRIISPDAIGSDVGLPPVQIHYAINSRMSGNASVQGRDLVYILPPESVRVASMVPNGAPDIRDASGADFGQVENLLLRASTLEVVATTCVALAVLVVLVVLVSLARRVRSRTPVGERHLTTRQLVGVAVQELGAVGREREQHGWTEPLVARALAATRLAATAAVGTTVSQSLAGKNATPGDGRLLHTGGLRGKARVISGSATPFDLDRAIKSSIGEEATRGPLLESLRDALRAFGANQYGRTGTVDQPALDAALASAQSAAAVVRAEHSWIKTLVQQWRSGSAAPVTSRA